MRLALDTNRYTDLCRDVEGVAPTLEAAEEIVLPFVVLAELRASFVVGTKGPANERTLRRFLLKPGVTMLFADDQTTHHYAALYRQLRRQGTPIPTNHLWIAARRDPGMVLWHPDAGRTAGSLERNPTGYRLEHAGPAVIHGRSRPCPAVEFERAAGSATGW